MKRFELFLLIVFCVGIFLFKSINFSFISVFIPGFILSIYYFGFSILIFNTLDGSFLKSNSYRKNSRVQILLSIISGVCFSIYIMSLIFVTLAWPGSLFMWVFAIVLLFALAIILTRKKRKITEGFYSSILNRIQFGILLLVAIILLKYLW
ncbi:MAG: hypothetical protein AUJ98_09075 [Bacteroidetes bacterium CG2_30_33_31]|nr:MAG: hypothetical protein AUJ98_09075 [Bacteroidetes bacterium CG2_30_33_31]